MFFHSFVHCISSQTLFFFSVFFFFLFFNCNFSSTQPWLNVWPLLSNEHQYSEFLLSQNSESEPLTKSGLFCYFYFLYHVCHTVIALPSINIPLNFRLMSFEQDTARELCESIPGETEEKGKKWEKTKWNFLHSPVASYFPSCKTLEKTRSGLCYTTKNKRKIDWREIQVSEQNCLGARHVKDGHGVDS